MESKLQNSVNSLVSSISESVEFLSNLQEEQLVTVTNKIDYVMTTKITDENYLSHLFDDLLNLTYWYGSNMNNLFYKLHEHVKSFNLELANDYETYYLEIINEEEIPLKKELKPEKE